MTRRPKQPPALSLFAFQDIITGVAGVMMFILMLLVVQLAIQTTRAASAQAAPASDPDPERKSIQYELPALKERVKQLRGKNKALTEIYGIIEKSSFSGLPGILVGKNDESAKLDGEIAKARGKAISGKSKNSQPKSEDERKEIQKAIEKSEAIEKELKDKIDAWKDQSTVAYATKNIQDRIWMADVTNTRIELFPIPQGQPIRKLSIEKSDDADSLARKINTEYELIHKAIKNRPKRQVVVLLRPSAANVGSELVRSLRNLGFDVALELLEEKARVYRRDAPDPLLESAGNHSHETKD